MHHFDMKWKPCAEGGMQLLRDWKEEREDLTARMTSKKNKNNNQTTKTCFDIFV